MGDHSPGELGKGFGSGIGGLRLPGMGVQGQPSQRQSGSGWGSHGLGGRGTLGHQGQSGSRGGTGM